MDEQMDGWADGRMDGQMDGWMDGWMDGRKDGWRDGGMKCDHLFGTTQRMAFRSEPRNGRTFLLHQQLQLISDRLVPLGDVHVQRVVATGLLIRGLLPALKRLQQALPGLGAHVID
ncbi:hypothetical protein EYF80_032031 [Liparis tanakae]|uniref:Uncharacterized protein n=1 Tax=Liparis tanakae TaxID=230148 RepID=A0A4Z2GYA7_9TELE|nr:hypothetical protein EYF80_032031 [Liparis tanakae]